MGRVLMPRSPADGAVVDASCDQAAKDGEQHEASLSRGHIRSTGGVGGKQSWCKRASTWIDSSMWINHEDR